MVTGETFPISSLAQMATIPPAIRSRFIAELPAILDTITTASAALPGFTLMPTATWTDDGDPTGRVKINGKEA